MRCIHLKSVMLLFLALLRFLIWKCQSLPSPQNNFCRCMSSLTEGYILMAPDFVPMAMSCNLGSKAKALGWWGNPCSTVCERKPGRERVEKTNWWDRFIKCHKKYNNKYTCIYFSRLSSINVPSSVWQFACHFLLIRLAEYSQRGT